MVAPDGRDTVMCCVAHLVATWISSLPANHSQHVSHIVVQSLLQMEDACQTGVVHMQAVADSGGEQQ